jgi:pseudaminic acid cytidylyltransferase
MNIAVIPARGGSKRIPRKNIRPFAGKPIIAHSIDAARATGLFHRIVVSTDDPEITAVARGAGAEVPFVRPPELSDDFAGTHEVIGHAVRWFVDRGEPVAHACCLYATAPLVDPHDIRRGLDVLREGGWSAVVAATPFPHPIFRAFEQVEDGSLRMFFPEHYRTRSQDLPVALHDAGQFSWATAAAWMGAPVGFGPRTSVVVLPHWRVQDIDTLEDWARAEQLYALVSR